MENIKLDERLKHLSIEEIEQVIDEYYSAILVSKIVEKYNIDIDASRLRSILPPKRLDNVICPYCKISMYQERPSKAATKIQRDKAKIFCCNCGHIEKNKCNCAGCENEYKELKKERIEAIKAYYSLDKKPKVSLNDMSIKERLYLGAFLRNCLDEDSWTIKDLASNVSKISPNEDYTKKMLEELIKRNILVINPNSNPEAFIVPYIDHRLNEIKGIKNSYDKDYSAYYIYKVEYIVNVYCEEEDLLENILFPNIDINSCKDDLEELWIEVATEECLKYLSVKASSLTRSFKTGKITRTSVRKMLETHSVSQVYNIIYKAHASISSAVVENKIRKEMAANMIIGRCMEYYERAVANNWELTGYHRIKECPETDISYFLFYRLIKNNEQGFYSAPSLAEPYVFSFEFE